MIISGMHRSGTSLVTSTLRAAGLDVGGHLMPAADGNNSKGFFENLDFVDLHKKILDYHGITLFGWTLEPYIEVPPEIRLQAEQAVAKNTRPHAWGWKDPRTVLFLDFWADLLPEAKFLFVHRAPWEVVDSLFRRGDVAFLKDPALAIRVWEHYNRLALTFSRKHPQRCLFVEVDTVAPDPLPLLAQLEQDFSISLSAPNHCVFDSSLLKKEERAAQRALLIQLFFPEAHKIWNELRSVSAFGSVHEPSPEIAPSAGILSDDILTDWMESRTRQREISQLQKTVFDLSSHLYHANERLQYLEKSRIWKLRNRLDTVRKLLSFQAGQ